MRIVGKFLLLLLLGITIACAGSKEMVGKDSETKLTQKQPYNPEAAKYFIRGTTAKLLNDWKSALINFQQALLYDSSSVTIYKNVAESYLELKETESALRVLEQAEKKFPEDLDIHYMLASIYYSMRDIEGAQKQYEKVLAIDPQEFDARNYLITLYMAQKQMLKVAEQYLTLYDIGHKNADLLVKAGNLYLDEKRFEEAKKIFDKLFTEFPDDERSFLAQAKFALVQRDTLTAIGWYQKGLEKNANFDTCLEELNGIYIKQKKWDKAIQLTKTIIDRDSSKIENYLRLGNLYEEKEDSSAAISIFRQVIERFPEDFRGYFSLARLYYQANSWREALPLLEKTTELKPNFPFGWIFKGFCHLRLQELEEAEKTFRNAVENFPDDARMNFYLASVLQQRKKDDEAIPYLEKALSIDPQNMDAITALAMIYDQKKIYQKSDSLYEVALQIKPDDPLILNNYSYSLCVRGIRLNEAKKMSEKAVAADSTNGAFLDTLGWIYFQLGNYSEALKYIEQAVNLRDTSAEVWEHLGDVYEKLNNLEKAKQSWKKALELESTRTHLIEKIGSK